MVKQILTPDLIGALVTNILIPVVLTAGAWLTAKIGQHFGAKASLTKAQQAQQSVFLLVTSMAGRAWSKLEEPVKRIYRDGIVSLDERKELEALINDLVYDFTSKDDLERLAKALNMPLSGLIATIAELVLHRFVAAHDPDDASVPAGQFKIAPDPEPEPAGG